MIELNKTTNLVDDYVIFDLETTGLKACEDEIIEIGALKYNHNELVATFNVLIKPKCLISNVITQITGIDNSLVANAPKIEEVLPEFLDFIGELPLIGHNINFDLGFLEENIKRLDLPMITNKNIDTLDLARIYIPKAYNHKLETLKKFFKLDFGSHRSIEDCKTTNYIYQYCKRKAHVLN